MSEYLSKIQYNQKKLGKQLKKIRINSGLELKDMPRSEQIELLERGQFNYVTAKYLIQHAHAIGCEIVIKDIEEVESPVQSLSDDMADLCRQSSKFYRAMAKKTGFK